MILLQALLVAVEIVVAVLLVAVILLQKPRGGGAGVAFGGGFGEAIFGPRMGNVLTRATLVLATIFLLNTLLLANLYSGRGQRSLMRRYQGGTRKARITPVDAAEPAEAGAQAAAALPEVEPGATSTVPEPTPPATAAADSEPEPPAEP